MGRGRKKLGQPWDILGPSSCLWNAVIRSAELTVSKATPEFCWRLFYDGVFGWLLSLPDALSRRWWASKEGASLVPACASCFAEAKRLQSLNKPFAVAWQAPKEVKQAEPTLK